MQESKQQAGATDVIKLKNMAAKNTGSDHSGFTVTLPSKAEQLESQKAKVQEASWLLSVFKILVTGFIAIALLLSLIATKLTIVSIGQQFNVSCTEPSCIRERGNETPYIMMILIMMIPQFISFITAVGNSAFSSQPWPSKQAIFWGMLSATAEVFGICLFTLVVATKECNASMIIIFMNGIYFFPIGLQIIKQISKYCAKRNANASGHAYQAFERFAGNDENDDDMSMSFCNMASLFLSFFLATGGMIYAVFLQFSKGSDRQGLAVLAFMLLVSFAWCPKVRKLQLRVKLPDENAEENPFGDSFNGEDEDLGDLQRIRIMTGRERITAMSSFVKLCLTPFVGALYAYSFKLNVRFKDLGAGFRNLRDNEFLSVLLINIICGFMSQLLAKQGCKLGLQKICFALPVILSTPLSLILVGAFNGCKMLRICQCKTQLSDKDIWETIILALLMWLAQIFSTTIYVWQSQEFLLAKESMLFWVPSYDGALIEQSLILNRKNEATDDYYVNYRRLVKKSRIYICTTMYHEADFEMEQLLHSISGIDAARRSSERQFESHIFLDDGARGQVIKWYALQLISLLPTTLGAKIERVGNKLETPYGLQLKWRLPGGMPFILHLKDNLKVKNKKRWSQVMYMSYVLDFKTEKNDAGFNEDDLTYILTTDADVKFTPEDVSALMDLMTRDHKVGAVCGRTRPMGNGPLVWYQIFDYAVGHWFLKVANHVFGSVLCSPGCFSVYRATAIRDVLPLYATGIDSALDFLTKDMGEDRWFCTLMVEAGWRLEYCAAAENSTYCPDNFDEFFKQRRRWGPSTLANQVLLINQQRKVRENNDRINFLFILYQIVLMVSTVVGPATVLLIVGGGLKYSYPSLNFVGINITLFLIVIFFIVICLKTKQDTQLKVAKLLTFFFAVVMAIAIVGLILKSVKDVGGYIEYYHNITANRTFMVNHTVHLRPTMPPRDEPLYFSPATWYLFCMIGLFILTAMVHGFEFTALVHGIWYLLCLPSGYLLLIIYSAANLTDRSWGTREKKIVSNDQSSFFETVTEYFRYFCWFCIPPSHRAKEEEKVEEMQMLTPEDDEEIKESGQSNSESELTDEENESATPKEKLSEPERDTGYYDGRSSPRAFSPVFLPDPPMKSALKKPGYSRRYKKQASMDDDGGRSTGFRFPGQNVRFAPRLPRFNTATSIEDWLPSSYREYVPIFKENGYENVSFIYGIKEKDLMRMGINNRGHRNRMMQLIESLPPEDIEEEVPDDVEEWLIKLGLEDYWSRFKENSYTTARDLADMKFMDKVTMRDTFEVYKEGHLRKLMTAVQKLQYPTQAQKKIREARKAIEKIPCKQLEVDNNDDGKEFKFWFDLRRLCLLPEQAAFGQSQELKEKLSELRDTSLGVLVVVNVLWLTFMLTVMSQGKTLQVAGTDFASVCFLFVYFLVLLAQNLAMILHRFETGVHLMARTPFKPGKFVRNWSFQDEELPAEPDPEELNAIRRRMQKRRASQSPKGSRAASSQESLHAPTPSNHIA